MGLIFPKNILNRYKIRPSKGLGQNFLIDKAALRKIISAAEIEQNDIILEIGPGLGILTQELASRTKKVIAVEKDPKMVEILKETLKDCKNVEIINADILKIENCKLIRNWKLKIGNYKVVANLPYYITSPVIRKFLESKNHPKLMVLMIQKEVAQRICDKPPHMSLLAVSVQFYAKPEIISYISKKSFWPQPKVDSAIIKISQTHISLPQTNINLFFKIVKTGFSQPRKQLANNLSKVLKLNKEKIRVWLSQNKINPKQRAETLSIKDWKSLTKSFKFIV